MPIEGAFPSLRSRFFRGLYGVALGAVLLVTGGTCVADYVSMRQLLAADVSRTAAAAAHVYAQLDAEGRRAHVPHYLESFSEYPGLAQLCAYDAQSALVAAWGEDCPPLLRNAGVEVEGFAVRVAQVVERGGHYLGMVYIAVSPPVLKTLLLHGAVLLAVHAAVALAACWLAAGIGARWVAKPLQAAARDIEHLKTPDDAGTLPELATTQEVAALADSIADMRAYLSTHTMSKRSMADVRGWHWDVLSGMLARLRHRLSADSPLLADLSDYALLLQTERGDIVPPPQDFNLDYVFDASLSSVRALQSADGRVNLTASLQSSMPRQWRGQPEMMETLLRHLLLIGLKRTRSGFVCLRVEAQAQAGFTHTHRLRVTLEDSGPLIQHGQLQQWLAQDGDDAHPELLADDISWLLTTRLFKRLGGALAGKSSASGGLMLEGMLPLYAVAQAPADGPSCSLPFITMHTRPPLILVVENDKEQHAISERLFAAAGCEVFMAHTHAQALEIAPILPFSAIVLNMEMADSGDNILGRLRYLAEDGVMPDVPLWAAIARLSFIEFDYWRQQGAHELLLKPLQPDMLRRLCAVLKPPDMRFYRQPDLRLRSELPPATLAALPELERMLAVQLAQVEHIVAACAQGTHPPDAAQQAHAVKSGALTLGYFRLAALMGEIEYAVGAHRFADAPQNWHIISGLLKTVSLENKPH